MSDKYILDAEGEPVPTDDLFAWGRGYESPARIVKREMVGESKISTVFLGLDYGWRFHGAPPILWETMVFGGDADGDMTRCSGKRADAMLMHQRMVERLKGRTE
jgi:hypothetical protein